MNQVRGHPVSKIRQPARRNPAARDGNPAFNDVIRRKQTRLLKTPDRAVPGPAPAKTAPVAASRIAITVAAAHAVNDSYASIVPPLLPRIMDAMDISIAAAATLGAAFAIATALPQPFFGYLADRFGRRIFAAGGVVATAVFVSLIGFAPSFWPLFLMLIIGGLGGAAFHPPGASYAVRIGAGRGAGGRYSVFSFGGAVGYAAGPLVAVALVAWGGLQGLWVAMLPAVVLAPVLFRSLPGGETRAAAAPPTPGAVLRRLAGPLGIIFGISAAMAFMQRLFLTMEPIIVADAGGSEALGAAALSIYLGSQAFGTLTGGFLADRMNRRRLIFHLCAWAVPVHLLAVWLGPWTLVGVSATAAAGFLGMAALPPIVVMAQEMHPDAAAASSGIVMGLAWAVGALGVMATGAVADAAGPRTATLLSLPAAGLAALLARHPGLRYDDPVR